MLGKIQHPIFTCAVCWLEVLRDRGSNFVQISAIQLSVPVNNNSNNNNNNNNNNNLIRSDLEKYETRNMSDKNQRFGASCAIIKVTRLMIKKRFANRLS